MLKPAPVNDASLPDASAIEEALHAIPGVRGVRVIKAADSEIGEIHVVATPRRSPKKIVRDIESFLMVQYAYRVDYRRISLVQAIDAAPVDRLTLGRVTQVQQPEGLFIEVELLNGEQRYLGSAALNDDPAFAASMATVGALNALFAPRAPLNIGGVECTTLGAKHVVIAYVIYQETSLEHVLGTTFIRNSVAEAAARAVLAATNRRLAGWLPEQRHVPIDDLIAA
jgi:hypothetical protein